MNGYVLPVMFQRSVDRQASFRIWIAKRSSN
jgi:hypothetical protein